jgi:hypothetical protein
VPPLPQSCVLARHATHSQAFGERERGAQVSRGEFSVEEMATLDRTLEASVWCPCEVITIRRWGDGFRKVLGRDSGASSERTVSLSWSRLGLSSGWCRCSLLVTQ